MRFQFLGFLCALAALLGGCFNTYNSTSTRGNVTDRDGAGLAGGSNRTIVNVNPGMTAPAPMTFAPTSYQEVYTTDYTPCGPVVKKAIVPIYGNGGASCNPGYMQQPGQPIPFQPCQSAVPVMSNYAPAQPVQSAIAEPVAWFGPSGTPTYSTQTSWY